MRKWTRIHPKHKFPWGATFIVAILITILFVVCVAYAASKPKMYGDVKVTYVRNYDADTITVNVPDWPDIIGKEISVRINGIDAPEMRGGNEQTKQLADRAKRFVGMFMKFGDVELKNIQRGKYFRIVADVEVGGFDLGSLLVATGYARVYDGKTSRPDWTLILGDPNDGN